MKNFFKKTLSVVGTTVLGVLGFSSCDPFITRCEYGTPNSSFKVDLTVLDENGKALEGIKVIPAEGEYHGLDEYSFKMSQGQDTLVTDSSGKAGRTYRVMVPPDKLKVYFEDKDGSLNGGSFAKDSAEFVSEKTGKGDNHWYNGEWTVSGTKKLKKQ